MSGAWIGARISHAEPVVQKYTGLSLFAQGGVAIGLSIMATQHLQNMQLSDGINLSDIIITGVTATTFIVQILGPPMTKLAVKLAKETGKNITEEDIIAEWKVSDVLDSSVPHIKNTDSVKQVVAMLSESDYFCMPVVDQNDKSIGMISMNDLKQLMADQDTWEWILAGDIVALGKDVITKSESLNEALKIMKQLDREQLPVVETAENPVPVGIIDTRTVRRLVNRKLISK